MDRVGVGAAMRMRMKQYDAVSSHAAHSVQSVELLLALIQDRQRVAVANANQIHLMMTHATHFI